MCAGRPLLVGIWSTWDRDQCIFILCQGRWATALPESIHRAWSGALPHREAIVMIKSLLDVERYSQQLARQTPLIGREIEL
jgi:hypothetical protein